MGGWVGFFFNNLRTRVYSRGCENGKGGNTRDPRPAEAGTGSPHPRRFSNFLAHLYVVFALLFKCYPLECVNMLNICCVILS
jgi:hypothetical protein